jgi:hypothetical protein
LGREIPVAIPVFGRKWDQTDGTGPKFAL